MSVYDKNAELYAQFGIDPTAPGDRGQSDPAVQAALADLGREILAETIAMHQTTTDKLAAEHQLSPDAKMVENQVSQYHTASNQRLDRFGRPTGELYDPNFQTPVFGQYHTAAGMPLDNMGRPIEHNPDAHYNEQVRQVGIAHQLAAPHQTMAGQYHTSGGIPLDTYGLPIEDAPALTVPGALPNDKSNPANVEAANRAIEEAGGKPPSAHIGSDTAPVTPMPTPAAVVAETEAEHHDEEHHDDEHHS